MKKGLLLAILAVSIAFLILSSIFRPLTFVMEGEGRPIPGEGEEGEAAIREGTVPCRDWRPPEPGALFEVLGQPLRPYMRERVGEVYEDGAWRTIEKPREVYTGELLAPTQGELAELTWTVLRYRGETGELGLVRRSGEIEVNPLLPMEGFVPTIFQTTRLEGFGENTCYYPLQFAFSVPTFGNPYSVEFEVSEHAEGLLMVATVDAREQYTQLPGGVAGWARGFALEITRGTTGPYGAVTEIADFLRTNYEYDENYTACPAELDPVYWFLFEERRGVCVQFNSALVVLARALGIPSRVVSGFSVDPDEKYQLVGSNQAHLWAEVHFEDLGWVQFDATPPGRQPEPIRTTTEIVKLSENVLKGGTFKVWGKVTDPEGMGVGGFPVLIYMKRYKAQPVLSSAQGEVENGVFQITVEVGENVEVGEYHVVARALGGKVGGKFYGWSESDPELRVYSETELRLEAPSRVIVGREFQATAVLSERMTESPLGSERISIWVSGTKVGDRVTDNGGLVQFAHRPGRSENLELRVTYAGPGYYLGSSDEKNVEAVPMHLKPMTPENLTRGTEVRIFGEVPLPDERVEIYLGGERVGERVSRDGGLFELRYGIPTSRTLGPLEIEYRVPLAQYSLSQTAFVHARTTLELEADKVSVHPGENLDVTATLVDDLGGPIAGAPITLRYPKLLRIETDDRGKAVFRLRVPEDQRGELELTASFEGEGFHLPSTASVQVPMAPPPAMAPPPVGKGIPLWLVAAGAGAGAVIAVALKFWRRKKVKPKAPPRPRISVQIHFPQIREPLPDVWGVGDEFSAGFRVTGKGVDELEVRVDGEGRSLKLRDGGTSFNTTFREKGIHRIEAECKGVVASRELKVVDYREEIIGIYKSIFDPSKERFGLGDNATPREFARAVLEKVEEVDEKSLDEFVRVFEIATYSPHSVGRKDYETEYLANLSLKQSLERKPAEAEAGEGAGKI